MMQSYNPLTPRLRSEVEPSRLMRSRRPLGMRTVGTGAQTIVTARADADFMVEQFWVANISGGDATYSLHVTSGGATPAPGNAIALAVPIGQAVTRSVVGASGLLLSPGQSLVAVSGANGSVNVFGHGVDIIGDVQG